MGGFKRRNFKTRLHGLDLVTSPLVFLPSQDSHTFKDPKEGDKNNSRAGVMPVGRVLCKLWLPLLSQA